VTGRNKAAEWTGLSQ